MKANRWLFIALCGLGLVACDGVPPEGDLALDGEGALPAQIHLRAQLGSGEGVRLLDKTVLPDAQGADLSFGIAMVMSLRAPRPMSICVKGKLAALKDIPIDSGTCPGSPSGTWMGLAYLSASSRHTEAESDAIGLGLLVRSRDDSTLFRLRILGDSYSAETGASVRFEFEAVPAQ